MKLPASWKFPLLLGACVVACEAGLALMILASAPAGTRWLGGTIQNTSDTAIYLSYIAQAADHGLAFVNPFAPEIQHARFDLVWSALGFVSRLGIPPLLAHEMARWVFTLILAVAAYAAARSVAKTERDARLATLLAFLGVGAGSLYVAWVGITGNWTTHSFVGPDMTSEYAIAPMTVGGPHILLSIALLVTSLRLIWKACAHPHSSAAWIAALLLCLLFAFHPYYAVLVAVMFALSVAANRTYRHPKELVRIASILALSGISLLAVYGPLLFDPVFMGVHNQANLLPLGPWYVWLISLLPFIAALVWRWKKRIALKPEERWIVAWLLAVIVSLLLPITWKRKLTEGAQIGFVLLTLPAWIAVRDLLSKMRLRTLLVPLVLLAAGFAPLQIVLSQAAWISRADRLHWFYAADDTFDGFAAIKKSTPTSAIVTSDDSWINFWIPAYALRTSWVGHDHATTHFAEKKNAWNAFMASSDPAAADRILSEGGVTNILATKPGSAERLQALLAPEGWQMVWREGDAALFERNTGLPPTPLPATMPDHAAPPGSDRQNQPPAG